MSLTCMNVNCETRFTELESSIINLQSTVSTIQDLLVSGIIVLNTVFDDVAGARTAALTNYKGTIKKGSILVYQLSGVPTGMEVYNNTLLLEQVCFDPSVAYNSDGTINLTYTSTNNDSTDAILWACFWCILDDHAKEIKKLWAAIADILALLQDNVISIYITASPTSKNVWNDTSYTLNVSLNMYVKKKFGSTSLVTSGIEFYDCTDSSAGELISSTFTKTKTWTASLTYKFYGKYTDSDNDDALFTSPVVTVAINAYFPSFYAITDDKEYDSTHSYDWKRVSTPGVFLGLKITLPNGTEGNLFFKTKYDFVSALFVGGMSALLKGSMNINPTSTSDGYNIYVWPSIKLEKEETILIN